MKNKKIAILTVISIMIVSGLTGCGQKVTAENLLDGAYGSKKVESMDADLTMNADADIDISDLLEDAAEQSADAVGSTTMNFKVAMDCNIKATEKIAYADGTATVDILGMSQNVPVKSYADMDNKVSYTYDENYDVWVKSDLDYDESSETYAIGKIDKDIFTNLKLADTKEGDSEYTVTGKVAMSDLEKLYGNVLGNEMDYTENIDLSSLELDVTMKFDKESRLIKSLECKVDPESLDTKEYTINEFSAKVTINKSNDVDVEIPSDVVDKAVEG